MSKIVESVEKLVIRALIVLLLLAIVMGTGEIARVLIADVLAPPVLLLEIPTVFSIFGLVLVILIGLGLIKSMKMFLNEEKVRPELVTEVAMIALCNKVITLDAGHLPGAVPLGVAALLIALSAAYFVVRRIGAR